MRKEKVTWISKLKDLNITQKFFEKNTNVIKIRISLGYYRSLNLAAKTGFINPTLRVMNDNKLVAMVAFNIQSHKEKTSKHLSILSKLR